jgi:hypothetical protein
MAEVPAQQRLTALPAVEKTTKCHVDIGRNPCNVASFC